MDRVKATLMHSLVTMVPEVLATLLSSLIVASTSCGQPAYLVLPWSILSAFDALHQGGSHQNVFTFRLTGSHGLVWPQPKLLDINQFPTGVKYHGTDPLCGPSKRLWQKTLQFHMCWTSNKIDKIRYFRMCICGTSKNSVRAPQAW